MKTNLILNHSTKFIMKKLFLLLLLQCFTSDIYCQIFLNGSFEINNADSCMINNMTNLGFDSLMSDVKGIGLTQTLDIFKDTDCPGFGVANDGHHYVSVENNSVDSTQSTAISLKLADSLQAGMSYHFSFYDRAILGIGTGPIQVGVSNTDSTFGTLIYVSPLIDTIWTKRTVSFNSPGPARYVTVKYGALSGGAIVDNFGQSEGTMINEENFIEDNIRIFPNPTTEELKIEMLTNHLILKRVRILNLFGQELFRSVYVDRINVSSFASGLYILEISANEKTFFIKFLKQ